MDVNDSVPWSTPQNCDFNILKCFTSKRVEYRSSKEILFIFTTALNDHDASHRGSTTVLVDRNHIEAKEKDRPVSGFYMISARFSFYCRAWTCLL